MSSYLWIIRWRADYRPERPFPPLSHSFWDDPTAKRNARKSGGGTEKRGGVKFGLWAGAWHDDTEHEDGGDGDGDDIARVYVPFVPGFKSIFSHVRQVLMMMVMMVMMVKMVVVVLVPVLVVILANMIALNAVFMMSLTHLYITLGLFLISSLSFLAA